jgi:hypothetical protein
MERQFDTAMRIMRQWAWAFVLPILLLTVERVGAFETDLHYGLTYWLSHQAAFSPRESHEIARSDEASDTGDLDAKYQIIWRLCILRRQDASSIVRDLHFRSETNVPAEAVDRPVAHGPTYAGLAASQSIDGAREGNFQSLRRLGSALHGWQVTYSHVGETTAFFICNERLAWAHPKARGGAFSHDADRTSKDPEGCMGAAETTFEKLRAARQRGWGESKSPEWVDLRKHVRAFCAAPTKTDKFRWFETYGVPQGMAIAKSTSLRDGTEDFRETPELDLSSEPVKDAVVVPAYLLDGTESPTDGPVRRRIQQVVDNTKIESSDLLRRWFDDFLRAWLTTTPAAMPAAVSEVMRQQLSPRDAESLLRLRMLDRGADVDSIRGSTSTDRVVTGDASNFRALLVPVRGNENAGLIGFDQSGGPVNALAILRNAPSDVLTIHGQVYEGSVFVKAMEFVVFH